MQIILLSGGSGKRLWPLSNDIRSKQFLKIFKNASGQYESMVQRMYGSIKTVMPSAMVTVATSASQVDNLKNHLGDNINVCIEPTRRDTFPAIALAAAYLKNVKNVSDNEPIVVCPVDPYVDEDYFNAIRIIGEKVNNTPENLILMGIKPTYPSEKYGYIVPDSDGKVKSFKEKPDLETAKALLAKEALWNGGVFGFKLGYMLSKAHELIDFDGYEDLKEKYESLSKISVDYAVVEKEKKIKVIPFEGKWMDVGTWKTLTDVMDEKVLGKAIIDDTCENSHVINELDVPVLAMGLKNIVVAASPDGILVADKHQSSYMKPFVDRIQGPVMYAEKSWGSYKVIDVEETGITVKVTLLPGHAMNYHRHEHRDEIWTVLDGFGEAIVDGKTIKVKSGDTINLPRGTKHMLKADTKLVVVEVQIGKDIDVNDKIID